MKTKLQIVLCLLALALTASAQTTKLATANQSAVTCACCDHCNGTCCGDCVSGDCTGCCDGQCC